MIHLIPIWCRHFPGFRSGVLAEPREGVISSRSQPIIARGSGAEPQPPKILEHFRLKRKHLVLEILYSLPNNVFSIIADTNTDLENVYDNYNLTQLNLTYLYWFRIEALRHCRQPV